MSSNSHGVVHFAYLSGQRICLLAKGQFSLLSLQQEKDFDVVVVVAVVVFSVFVDS